MAQKVSKQEAVRRALAHFGNDAKPLQMQPWIKDELGIEMGTDHISTAKGDILRKAGAKGPARKAGSKAHAKKATEKATPPAQAGPKPSAAKAAAIPIDDILYVKALVGRLGPEQLHRLIDAFAR